MTTTALQTNRPLIAILNWQQTFCFLSLVLMEALWLAPLLHRMFSSVILDDVLAMPLENLVGLVALNMLAGLVVRRILVYFRIPYKNHRYFFLPILAISVVATLATLPILLENSNTISFDLAAAFDTDSEVLADGYLITPLVIFLFMRGSIISRYLPPPVAVGISSRLAIGLFFLTAVVAEPDVQGDMAVLLPFFFFVLLLANSLARSSALKASNLVQQVRFSRRWFGMLLSALLGTVLIGVLVSAFFGGLDQDQIRRAFEIPFIIFISIIILILSPFAYAISWLISQVPPPSENDESITPETGTREVVPSADNPQIDIGDELRLLFDTVSDALLWVVMIAIAIMVILFWISVFLRPEDLEIDEGSEAIGEREHIQMNLFGKPFKRLFKALSGLQQGVGGNLFGVLTIRWAYSRMERMGRKRGFPRDKAQTPYEYRAALAQAFPGGENDIRTITNAYVAIRYGELPENNTELEQVRRALDALKTIPTPPTP